MARKLKVYRTPIGFHDAYVAAPNQKAALKAWGSDADLFARGLAETVTDATLMREPLEHPGAVIRRPRGTAAQHMAALPADAPRPHRKAAPARTMDEEPPTRKRRAPAKAGQRPATPDGRNPVEVTPPKPAKPQRKRKPARHPSRAKLDAAETAVEEARVQHQRAIAEIRRREQQLQTQRRALEARHETAIKKLEDAVARERDRHSAALRRWRS